MARNENDRKPDFTVVQLSLEIQAAHTGHTDVSHQTADSMRLERFEERGGRLEALTGDADRFEHQPERLPDAAIVVDDVNHGPGVHCLTHWSITGSETTKVEPPPSRRSYPS